MCRAITTQRCRVVRVPAARAGEVAAAARGKKSGGGGGTRARDAVVFLRPLVRGGLVMWKFRFWPDRPPGRCETDSARAGRRAPAHGALVRGREISHEFVAPTTFPGGAQPSRRWPPSDRDRRRRGNENGVATSGRAERK